MSSKVVFDFKQLMFKVGAPTAQVMAEICGLNARGCTTASTAASAGSRPTSWPFDAGFLPWEVWPEWADIDPAAWMPPVCNIHGNDFAVDTEDLGQECSFCCSMSVAA